MSGLYCDCFDSAQKLDSYLESSLQQERQALKVLKPEPPPPESLPATYTRSAQILGMTAHELEEFMSNGSRDSSVCDQVSNRSDSSVFGQ